MAGALLFTDPDDPVVRPLTRLRSRFCLRNGVYTEAERARILHPGAALVFRHPDTAYESLVCRSEGMVAWSGTEASLRASAQPMETKPAGPASWLSSLSATIQTDIELLLSRRSAEFLSASSPRISDRFRDLSIHVVGPPDHLHLHRLCHVMPGCVLDVRHGPILLDEHVRVTPFSFLEGSLYVGPHARLDNVRITGGSVIGHSARVGGEIENSIVNDFSNKHHEGFLGHSVLAPWVNLGALATTSDLKNNYGQVRLRVPREALVLSGAPDLIPVDTGTLKFGALIGECAKIAIGTMLATGTVVDAGANVFGGAPPTYVPPFRWGPADGVYEFSRFVHDAHRIFARRDQIPGSSFEALARRAHPGGGQEA